MSSIHHLFGAGNRNVEKQVTASEIAEHIRKGIPNLKSGTLCFWGVWFGRPYDNWHTIVKTEAEGECLTLNFNDEEILQIWNPADYQIDEQHFIIRSASRVL